MSWPIRGLSLGRQWRMSNLRVWLERGRRELKHRHGSQGQVRCTGSVAILTRQRRLPFLHVLPTLVEDLLDIVGRSYDGIDYVVLDDVHETMLDPGESDHPLAAVGVVAQTPRDVAANFGGSSAPPTTLQVRSPPLLPERSCLRHPQCSRCTDTL